MTRKITLLNSLCFISVRTQPSTSLKLSKFASFQRHSGHTYIRDRDGPDSRTLFSYFSRKGASVTLVYVACFLQLLLNNAQAKAQMPLKISMMTSFKAQFYFHSVFLMSREVENRKLNINKSMRESRISFLAFQLLQTAWDAPTKFCSLTKL